MSAVRRGWLLSAAPGATSGGGGEAGTSSDPSEDGMVTLEIALAVPLVLIATVASAMLLSAGVQQARVEDAARAAARELARGESPAHAIEAGLQVSPGASVQVRRSSGVVEVSVHYQVQGPGPLLSGLSRTVSATAVTRAEESW